MIRVEEIEFATAEEIWRAHLWPGRAELRATSSMMLGGGYDLSFHDAPVIFVAAKEDGRLLGVNSVFRTGPRLLRSRGLCVLPEHRGRGVGQALLADAVARARADRGLEMLWSFPRRQAWPSYASLGFESLSEWTEQDGRVNCYAALKLK